MMMSFISLIKIHFNRRGIEQSLAKVPALVKPFLMERAVSILEKSPEERRNVLLRSQDEAYLQLDKRAAIRKKDIITKYNATINGHRTNNRANPPRVQPVRELHFS